MALTYSEFKKIVPKETSDFFDILLPYLNYYIGHEHDLEISNCETNAHHKDSKTFFLTLYAISELKEYRAFLGECGYKKNLCNVKVPTTSNTLNPVTLEPLYEKYNYLIPVYEDKTLYQGLQPLEIVLDAYKKYNSNCLHTIFNQVFSVVGISTFKAKMLNIIEEKKQEREKEIEKQIYNQIPISVISHIELASKVRAQLQKKLTYNSTSICKDLDSDIVPLSLLIALYFDSDKDPNKNAIACLLKEKGITHDKIMQTLGINITEYEIIQTNKNIFAIQELYKKYYEVSETINLNPSTVSIQGLVKSILDRSFTNSLVIEKIFSKLGYSVSEFRNIEEESRKAVSLQRKNKEQAAIKAFYKNVPKKTRDFLEFSCKTYTYLVEKMVENKHNSELLATEIDAVCLSLYIANHFFGGDVSTFFNDNGVKFEEVLKLLKIEINKDEIDKRVVDKALLVDKFKALVYEGENKGISSNKITINDISKNLCKREYTKTMILENIFNSLSIKEIENSFLNQINQHFEEKKKKEEMLLTQKIFYDIPIESVTILENASRVYQKILKSKKNVDKKTAQSIAILISVLEGNKNEAKDLFICAGFDKRYIVDYFVLDNSYLFSSPVNINLLTEEFGELIFGINNKERKRSELTPLNICRNIFSKEFNNSVSMSKFLAEFKLTYEDVCDLDKLSESIKEKKDREKRENAIKQNFNGYPSESISQIKEATKIHQILTTLKEKGQLDETNLKTETDFEMLCMLLAVLNNSSQTKSFFEHNNFTLASVYKLFNLNPNTLYDKDSIKIDYDLLDEKYLKYLKCSTNMNCTYVRDIFTNILSNNSFIKNVADLLHIDYEVLEREITTGKNFEDTLTVDDRIKRLNRCEVEVLDPDNMQSILAFGNSLIPHSKFIHGELPSLMKDDITEKSISRINEIIGEMYRVEKTEAKHQGTFLTRLFQGEEQEESKVVLDRIKMSDLKSVINVNIDRLKKELLQYDAIRRYIEKYTLKNRDYFQVAEQATGKISERLADLDPNNDDEYAEYLTTSSFFQIINDKATRFATVNLLMRKELLKVNQAIVNHFVTINSLEMARDDLIPLIESELLIAEGRDTENQALDLSRSVMGLFQSLLARNVESTIENMNKLQQTSISHELMTSINNEINTYIQGVSQIKALEEKISESKEEQLETKAPKQKK